MNFNAELRKLEGQTFSTLDQNKKFDVLEVGKTFVTIHVHSKNNDRFIPMSQIVLAWERLLRDRVITRAQIQAEYAPRNPAYVASLLARLPGVQHHLKPITLRIRD